MRHGTWVAYCGRTRVMSLDTLESHLAPNTELTLRRHQSNVLVATVHDSLTGNEADVTISLDTGPHVAAEAAELAEQAVAGERPVDLGVPPPDIQALAKADARYEMTWDLQFSYETYNTMAAIAGILGDECAAIVYDVTNRRFV